MEGKRVHQEKMTQSPSLNPSRMDANGQLGRWDQEGAETQLLVGAQPEELVHTES